MTHHQPISSVSVIGMGYIGLPTAAMFAERKIQVTGVDIDPQIVDTINQGNIHILEPDLDRLVSTAVTTGFLRATTKPEPADAFIIAVPTPVNGQNEPDLSYIASASREIAPVLKKGDLVVLESTSPVTTTEQMAAWIAQARPDLTVPLSNGQTGDIFIAYCPERVLPGQVARELIENDRVIGGINKASAEKACQLYRLFVKGECIMTHARTAEMAKLTENASRDVSIAFANELSVICDKLAINVWELIALANRHPRVNILQPGPGVGGHCIAVDPWFIVSQAPKQTGLIQQARRVNDHKPQWVMDKVSERVDSFLAQHPEKERHDVIIACFGLAFKADIDDLRESPALQITRSLVNTSGCKVMAVEPNTKELREDFDLVSLDTALEKADIYVLLVDHMPFKRFKPVSEYIVDTRGIWT
ncbi:UDP-N-acetyl-D-mannosamine dehydrogenase [Candidatus Sororendozoicomonas aggregata]|uniref:UDP-N-acetyl-D-mannosamine dehydrogenase n=1 Tax=Candidatus Sororendozoicomonas aggregata TaxID=3073239 RepID=UPI002ED1D8C5